MTKQDIEALGFSEQPHLSPTGGLLLNVATQNSGGEDITINVVKLPSTPDGQWHVNLTNAGFPPRNIGLRDTFITHVYNVDQLQMVIYILTGFKRNSFL